MPISESFAAELESAVEQSVADVALIGQEEGHESTEDASVDSEVKSSVGAEGGDGETGTSGNADADGRESVEAEGGSVAEGDGKSDAIVESAKVASISDAMLTEAVQHGIPIEDARLFPSDETLGKAIGAVKRSIEQLAPKKEEKQEEEVALAIDPAKLDEFDDDVKAVLSPIIDVVRKQQEQLKELREQTKQYHENAESARQQANRREVTEWFDVQVAKLGDDFKEVLGVGGTEALPPNSPQKAKRDAIANQASILFAGYAASGIKPKSRDEVFEQAAKIVLADHYAKLTESRLSESLRKRSKQHIQRAGGNQKQKATGDPAELAASELAKLFPQLAR